MPLLAPGTFAVGSTFDWLDILTIIVVNVRYFSLSDDRMAFRMILILVLIWAFRISQGPHGCYLRCRAVRGKLQHGRGWRERLHLSVHLCLCLSHAPLYPNSSDSSSLRVDESDLLSSGVDVDGSSTRHIAVLLNDLPSLMFIGI